MQFKDLLIGETFDFIGPHVGENSFFDRCRKISARRYCCVDDVDRSFTVGSGTAIVYHVEGV